MERFFIVNSAGRTGTHWLTKVLNLHSDVFCTHGPDLNPEKNEGEMRFERIQRERMALQRLPADEYFDMLEKTQRAKCYGNVHGGLNIDAGSKRNYVVCNIVRHPIKRIVSFVNRWEREVALSEYSLQNIHLRLKEKNLQQAIQATPRCLKNVDMEKTENYLFLNALFNTMNYDYVAFKNETKVFSFERMVADIDYYLTIFIYLCGSDLVVDDQYLTRVANESPIDETQKESIAKLVFDQWDSWKREIFLELLEFHDLGDAYVNWGYDLAYLKKSR
jgi:hypothetical protein